MVKSLTLLFGRRTLNNRMVIACLKGDIMWPMSLNARYCWTYGDNEHQPNLGTNSSRRQRPRVGIFGKDVSDIRHGTCQGTLCCEEHEARYRGERGEVLPKRGDGRGRGDGEKGREGRAREQYAKDKDRITTRVLQTETRRGRRTRSFLTFCFLFLLFAIFTGIFLTKMLVLCNTARRTFTSLARPRRTARCVFA